MYIKAGVEKTNMILFSYYEELWFAGHMYLSWERYFTDHHNLKDQLMFQ